MKLKNATVFFILLVTSAKAPMHAMDEPEVWNCEFFNFANQVLKEFVVSLRFKCNESSTADKLFTAIRTDNVTEVATLLQEYPQLIDTAEDADGMTPLLAATIMGNASIVTQMLNRVPPPKVDRTAYQGFAMLLIKNIQEWQPLTGFTPLMAAAKWNQINIAKQLLGAGASKNPDLKDEGSPRRSALDYARESGNINLVNLLQ